MNGVRDDRWHDHDSDTLPDLSSMLNPTDVYAADAPAQGRVDQAVAWEHAGLVVRQSG